LLLLFLLLLVRRGLFLARRILLAESQGAGTHEQEQNQHNSGCHSSFLYCAEPDLWGCCCKLPLVGLGRMIKPENPSPQIS
jgi:hypothetical protein